MDKSNCLERCRCIDCNHSCITVQFENSFKSPLDKVSLDTSDGSGNEDEGYPLTGPQPTSLTFHLPNGSTPQGYKSPVSFNLLLSDGDTSKLLEAKTRSVKGVDAKHVRLLGCFRASGHRSILIIAMAISLIASFGLLALGFASRHEQWSEDGYIRYPTPNSIGPKRQLRILYRNASTWTQTNPHRNGEWKVRIDDQALIPTAAWDSDEDRYQAWFAERYPEMRKVVETRNYIRPAWLGSLNISVSWDNEFHLAHCVLTMKRYWKAKETGRHVCPRDIYPPHIQHCLNWLDGIVFKPEPGLPEMGQNMTWQSKVCY